MIATVSGIVRHIGSGDLIVDVGGVGLRLFVPRNVLQNVAGVGRSLTLHTHLVVRENELALYGFGSEEALHLFEVLLGVSGVGPKVALAILSTLSPEVLKGAVMREEESVLQRVPGIGKKTAQRILFYLRDRLDLTAEIPSIPFLSDVDGNVIDVLTSLGFSVVEAQTAIQNIPPEVEELDARVQTALQYLDQI